MNEKETSRLEAFSDGVFAVAITLLVLSISSPVSDLTHLPDDGALWLKLSNEWPSFLAYIISFLTIGVMWLNHHRLFVHIKRIDTILLFINLLLLMIIVFIPFSTALLADYIVSANDHAAAVFYSGICLLMACCFYVLWNYAAYHHRLLGKNIDEAAVKEISRQYIFGPVLYLLAFGIAWLNTLLCLALALILALFFALPSRAVRSLSLKGVVANADEEENGQPEELEL